MKHVFVVVIGLLFVGAGCAQTDTTPISVATTIVPVSSIVSNILEGAVTTKSVLPAHGDAHDVTLSTRELQAISEAETFIMWGKGIDDWARDARNSASKNQSSIIATSFIESELNDDPHAWLSPKKMIPVVEGLGVTFGETYEAHKERIHMNTNVYTNKLRELDQAYEALKTVPNKEIVTLHDAFGYVADDYGLRVVATIKDLPEDAPSPQDVARVISVLKKNPNAALFAESEISPMIVDAIARDTGRTIYVLDPLEVVPEGVSIQDAYTHVMQKNLEELLRALSKK